MRIIKLKLLTQEQLVSIQTEARTFGEFKKEEAVQKLEIDWSAAKLIDRATKTSLELDEAVLPEVDSSIMFVMPTKTKSGADLSYKEAKEQVKNLVDSGKIGKVSWVGKTTQDLNNILDAYHVTDEASLTPKYSKEVSNSEHVDKDAIVEEIQELLIKVSNKVNELSKLSGNDTSVLAKELKDFKANLAEFVTNDELTKELKDIQNRIK